QGTDSSGNTEGAVYDGTMYTPINVPGAVSSYPHGIDLAGDVVFSWTDSSGLFHGALLMSGKYYKFNDPKGTEGTYGDGINDNRVVVGVIHTNGGANAEGFKATY